MQIDSSMADAEEGLEDPIIAADEDLEEPLLTELQEEFVSTQRRPRLQSLDGFRGLVIIVMLLVDDAGPAYGHVLDHSPWHGIRLADFVMPFFLFIVGISIAMSFRTFDYATQRCLLLRKMFTRSFKLFILGMLLQGASPFGSKYDLNRLRIPGILQRISICYAAAVVIELCVPRRAPHDAALECVRFASKYLFHILALVLNWSLYIIFTFITPVPGCEKTDLSEKCNAARVWDNSLLGINHMYQEPVYLRSRECSSCYPSNCPRSDAPGWCSEPFDPEGSLTTFGAVGSCTIGVLFGRFLIENIDSSERIVKHFSVGSTLLFFLGYISKWAGIPFNKNLYTLSYELLMAGASGFCLIYFYVVVDVLQWRVHQPLVWVGMNSILVFVGGASNTLETFLKLFYWREPSCNVVDSTESLFFRMFGPDLGLLFFVFLKFLFWIIVCSWLFDKKKIFKI